MSAKRYENPTMLSRVTAKNVGDVFWDIGSQNSKSRFFLAPFDVILHFSRVCYRSDGTYSHRLQRWSHNGLSGLVLGQRQRQI